MTEELAVRCSVDAVMSGSPHTADQPHPDWHIRTASGQEFYACDGHIASLLYFNGPNVVTSTSQASVTGSKEADHG